MVRRAWLPLLLLPCGACSILYNTDNLPPPSDARVIDTPEVDAALIDADPTQLTLTGTEPTTLLEGVGAANGRPALLRLHGTSLVGSAVVSAELLGGGEQPMVVGFDASVDGTEGAVAIRIPVIPGLHAADPPRTLRITVNQGAGAIQSIDATVTGLEELTMTSATETAAVGVATYSSIAISTAVRFTGDNAVRLVATGGVTLDARIDGSASGTTPGPHGNRGGVAATDGDYTPGGGIHGQTTALLGLQGSGGGGGGFGAAGTGGTGDNAGGPGGPTGNEWLVPLVSAPGAAGNRGNGGGGGGSSTLGTGGVGGGGGGVIAITAGGDIVVGTNGQIWAKGGTANGGSGGGGGGSGGAILVRTGGALTVTGAWVDASGGGASTGAGLAGGRGGVGRVRIDAAGPDPRSVSVTGAIRGPAWSTSTPVIATTLPALTLTGEPGRDIAIRLNDAEVATVQPGSGGSVEVRDLAWLRGRNTVCAVARAGSLLAESLACIDVYLTLP